MLDKNGYQFPDGDGKLRLKDGGDDRRSGVQIP
jgi:hypothetical protein